MGYLRRLTFGQIATFLDLCEIDNLCKCTHAALATSVLTKGRFRLRRCYIIPNQPKDHFPIVNSEMGVFRTCVFFIDEAKALFYWSDAYFG